MGEMNVRKRDFELLQSFVRQGEQTAFDEMVRGPGDHARGSAIVGGCVPGGGFITHRDTKAVSFFP